MAFGPGTNYFGVESRVNVCSFVSGVESESVPHSGVFFLFIHFVSFFSNKR